MPQACPSRIPFPLGATIKDPTCSDAMSSAVSHAIERWDLDRLLELLKAGADVHQAGPVALKMAAQENHLEHVRELLSTLHHAGVSVNTVDQHGDLALAVAAREGHEDVVSAIAEANLQTGGEINTKNKYGFTALSEAAYKGHAKAAEVLIKALKQSGEDINLATDYGFTPLTRAAYMGQWEVVHLLAEAIQASGGDVNVVTPGCGSALTLAIEASNLEAADRLLQYGAIASEEDIDDLTRLLGHDGADLNEADVLARATEMHLPGVANAMAGHMNARALTSTSP